MGDIYCKKCGEPWDYYGILNGDMAPEEVKRFLRGEGCPACMWGKKARKRRRSFEDMFFESLLENLE